MPHGALPSIDGRYVEDHNWMYFYRSYNLSPIDSYIPIYPTNEPTIPILGIFYLTRESRLLFLLKFFGIRGVYPYIQCKIKVMISRITEEESKQYVPCKEDYLLGEFRDARYYTLTPNEDGWDYVKYFTGRKIGRYNERDDDYDSWVYILTNPLHEKTVLKIGHTKYRPEIRAKQISRSTGVPLPYEVAYAFNCFNGEGLEIEVHRYLDQYRINNDREFFQLNIEDAKRVIEKLGERYIKGLDS